MLHCTFRVGREDGRRQKLGVYDSREPRSSRLGRIWFNQQTAAVSHTPNLLVKPGLVGNTNFLLSGHIAGRVSPSDLRNDSRHFPFARRLEQEGGGPPNAVSEQ